MTLLIAQIRYQLRLFVRSPISLFFVVVLPVVMLVVFSAVFGDDTTQAVGGDLPLQQFYVGALAAFSAASATFTNLANILPDRRQEGILKRWRSTPQPPWTVVGGFVVSSIIVAVFSVVLMFTLGVITYGVEVDAAKMPALALSFLVGVCAWALLGLAVGSLVRSPESAPAVANAIILPLGFLSNIFIAIEDPGPFIDFVQTYLPLGPLGQNMTDSFNPAVEAPAFGWSRVVILALWCLIGAALTFRFFRWEPYRGATRRRSRTRQPAR